MKKITLLFIAVFLLSSISANAAVQKEKRLWQDETIYSIMVDRFNNGDTKNDFDVNTKDPFAYTGGDFQGIIDKLDYIKGMGFTTIRLTSIFGNADGGYHGYLVNDFYKTDEHFGSIKLFQKLVNEAHERDMKVLIDFVTNNIAKDHPWINDSTKENWFHDKKEISNWSNFQEVEKGWVNGLPDLNQDNPEVKKYLIDAAKWWIKETNIDGYSLPEVNYVPVSFWGDFSKEVKKVKEDFFLLGVLSSDTSVDIGNYENAGIDSLFDYLHSYNLRTVFANTNQSFSPLFSEAGKEKVQHSELRANFLDNEYTARFTSDIVDNKQFPGSRWKTALAYLYSTPGIPVVFYGSEIALNGEEIPDNRQQMSFRAEKELIDFMAKLGELRNQLPSLSRGTMEILYEANGMAVYKRSFNGEISIIAINNTDKSQNVVLTKKHVEDDKELRGLLKGDLVKSEKSQYNIILDRDESEIYVLANKSGLNLPLIGSLVVVYMLVILFLVKLKKRKT